uniref:Uncharacterized protein n=1 Tax=Anguilla anguilla TaxID=7936 RepID=A0A0E9Q8K7_ANGAN
MNCVFICIWRIMQLFSVEYMSLFRVFTFFFFLFFFK